MSKLRALASDTAIYGVSTIVQRFLTFLLTPLYTNYLAPAELGEVSYLYSLLAFVNIVYSFGLDSAFFRFFKTSESPATSGTPPDAQDINGNHNRTVFSYAFGSIASISAALTIAFVLLAGRITSGIGFTAVNATVFALAACIALFDALTLIPYSAMRLERRAKRFAGTKLAVVVLTVALNLVFVSVMELGVRGVFLAGVISSGVGLLLVAPDIMRFLGKPLSANRALWKEMWRFGLPTLPSAFSAMILQVADRPIMASLLDAAAVGIYQANYRLGIPMMLAVSVFDQAWKPFYLREVNAAHSAPAVPIASRQSPARTLFPQVLTYFTVVCSLVFLLVSLLVEYVVQMPFVGGRFINPQYLSGLGVIPIVLAAYYFNGVFTNLAAATYIRKRTRYLPLATGIAAVVNVGLNFLLIPSFGIMGSAWATLGAYAVSALFMCRMARRIYPVPYQWRRIALVVALTGATYFVALVMTDRMAAAPAIFLRLCCIGLMLALFALLGFFHRSGVTLFKRGIRRT